jgi:hypothetical protein
MKGNGNNMTEWYGIGKVENPEAGCVVGIRLGESNNGKLGFLGALL